MNMFMETSRNIVEECKIALKCPEPNPEGLSYLVFGDIAKNKITITLFSHD
jgi:hypothetical protein